MAFIASVFTAAAADQPQPNRRLLRLPNDTNHRILESSSMSMATGSVDTVEIIDDIVSKVETEGYEIDPTDILLAEQALVVFEESAMLHHGGSYYYTKKCLKLLSILLPEYKASKISFICGEETVTTSTTAGCIAEDASCLMFTASLCCPGM